MATVTRGVVERANTIVENKKVLSELIRRNEFVEPSHKELCKLFTRLNADNARDLVKNMKSSDAAWDSKKITDRLYGPIPGIPCGSWWGIRMDCSRDRMHDPFSASVQDGPVGAVSICTSHSNEDIDLGDILTFTGQSCGDEEKYAGKLAGDKEQSLGNESLILSFQNRVPVRIIRSYNLSNEFSPKTGYRYDGLYIVVDYWIGVSSQNGIRCCKFALKRLLHQEPPPWETQAIGKRLESIQTVKQYSKNCDFSPQAGMDSRINNAGVNSNETIISRNISSNRFQNGDSKTPKAVRSPRKRRPRRNETSSEPESSPSASTSSQGLVSPTTLLRVSPGRKIVSTDHRNVHVSAIVTRRVSKKLGNNTTDNKLLFDCAANKLGNVVAVGEFQLHGNQGEEKGATSQSTRLQNTNISIRTDLYDSSHNLKQLAKKCGSSLGTHGTGIFKPRILGVPRRELNFAGVNSSPGSSRTVSSVKMERVKSVDSRIKQKNLDHVLCQEKEEPANGITDTVSKDAQEKQSTRDLDIVASSSNCRTFCSPVNDENVKNSSLERLKEPKSSRPRHIEHSYASECLESITREENSRNLTSETPNGKQEVEKTGQPNPKGKKNEKKTEFLEQKAAESSKEKETERHKTRELSVAVSPSHSPAFRGFCSPDGSKNEAETSWSETSMLLNSLTIEKMLDIITEQKSSPMAKMLISNVIGYPAFGSLSVFDETPKTENLKSGVHCETEKGDLTTKTLSRGHSPAISSTVDLQHLKNSSSRQLKRFENSREQKVIEIVYNEEEQGTVQKATDTPATENRFALLDKKDGEKETHDSLSKEEAFYLRLCEHPNICEEKNAPLRGSEDAVDFWSTEQAKGVVSPDLPTPSGSQTIGKTSKAQIITRSKCLQNSIRGKDSNSGISNHRMMSSLKPIGAREGSTELSEDRYDEKISSANSARDSVPSPELRSTEKLQQFDKKIPEKLSKRFPTSMKSPNLQNQQVPKSKSPKKMRLLKRSGVRVKRKMEIANLFIDMNMNPRSQMSKAKSRSRRSLRGAKHLRRRSCPAVVDHGIKRRNENPVKHPTSPLKRMKKSVQVQSSSVQVSSRVTPKKGLNLRKRLRNRASPSNNNNNNMSNINNNNSVKRIGKTEKVITKIKKPMKSRAQNLVAKKSMVNGLRASAEISKRREVAVARTRSGRSPRSLTVGRLGLRRALLSSTETYARQKKKIKIEKQKQKQTVQAVEKRKPMSAKQQLVKNDNNAHTSTSDAKKPRMVSVMTQCSLISVPPECPASLATKESDNRNLSKNATQNSDSGSECVYSSRDSGMDQIKHEIIELIEIKSEAVDDDVQTCDEEDNEAGRIRVQENPNSAFNRAAVCLKERTIQTLGRSAIQENNSTWDPQRLFPGLGAFGDRERSVLPRRGFIPYVAGHRVSAFVPVRSVDDSLTLAQLKLIGFKPIKPGLFSTDEFEDGSEHSRRSTSDSPRIAYSSAVVKRGVHEEYDKYTSEENNVVQYMDSRLCYEDIENEDVIFGSYAEPSFNDMFVEKMEFVKMGTEMEEESNDNSSFLQGGKEQVEEEEEDETEDYEKSVMKEWQSQLDENSSNSEEIEQNVVDSDGDVPWHGWRKIISNKKTYFVGW